MLKFWNLFASQWHSRPRNQLIDLFGAMVLFLVLFDGIVAYLLPILIIEQGFSKTLVGIIIGTAAVAGAFFDLVIYRIFKDALYRRLFIFMFAFCFIYIFIVWIANSFLLYVIAMAAWGLYYDLKNFGTLDFVGRYSPKKELSSNFGVLHVFQSLGYLLAPLMAGAVIVEAVVGWEPFALALVFLSVSAFFFAMLVLEARKKKQFSSPHEEAPKGNFLDELANWKKTGRAMLPVFLLASFATVFESFFMTIGPIMAESLPLEPFDGIFMVAHLLPSLVIGGFVGSLASRFGERNVVAFGLLIGASILATISFFESPFAIILVVFAASCFTCTMAPVVQSIYAHCIKEVPKSKKDVQELGDLFGNCGYIVGPVSAGAIADAIGKTAAFSVLGAMGILFALFLLVFMPKKISMKKLKG